LSEAKLKVALTRRWPDTVERLMADVFELRINDDNHVMSPAELADALAWADVLCPTVTDSLTSVLLSAPTVNAKLLANFGVGFNHIDMAAASRAGIAVTNTPEQGTSVVLRDSKVQIRWRLLVRPQLERKTKRLTSRKKLRISSMLKTHHMI
jgi:phosphoglycerate dehydrogenase-like enzyme